MSLHTSNRLAGLAQVAEVKLAVRRRCGQKEPGMRRLRGNPHAAGIDNARANDAPKDSYTAKLLSKGVLKCAQKVGEEGVETALAAAAEDDEALLGEAADLVFHLMVTLKARGLSLADVAGVLEQRHASKG